MFVSRKLANGIKIVEKSKKIPPPIQPINATKTVNGGRILQTGILYGRNNNICCSKSGKTHK